MKLRILLLSLLATYTIHLTAQELYSNDLFCVKADNNLAVIAASGIAEKEERCIFYGIEVDFQRSLLEWY